MTNDTNHLSFDPRHWLDDVYEEDEDAQDAADDRAGAPPPLRPARGRRLGIAAAAAGLILVAGGVTAFATREVPAEMAEIAVSG